MTKKTFLLYVLPIFICSNSYAIDFNLELKVNPSYTDCSIDESSPTKRLIDSVFKKNIIELENNGISANIIETSMMRCNYNWETKLLQWHVYDKKNWGWHR